MPTPPPRKFFSFQFHLSTAIVLMFVAGGMLGLNLTPRVTPSILTDARRQVIQYRLQYRKIMGDVENRSDDSSKFEDTTWGWPLRAYGGYRGDRFKQGLDSLDSLDPNVLFGDFHCIWPLTFEWNPWHVAADTGVAFAIVLGAGVLFERLIRRRAAQKSP